MPESDARQRASAGPCDRRGQRIAPGAPGGVERSSNSGVLLQRPTGRTHSREPAAIGHQRSSAARASESIEQPLDVSLEPREPGASQAVVGQEIDERPEVPVRLVQAALAGRCAVAPQEAFRRLVAVDQHRTFRRWRAGDYAVRPLPELGVRRARGRPGITKNAVRLILGDAGPWSRDAMQHVYGFGELVEERRRRCPPLIDRPTGEPRHEQGRRPTVLPERVAGEVTRRIPRAPARPTRTGASAGGSAARRSNSLPQRPRTSGRCAR